MATTTTWTPEQDETLKAMNTACRDVASMQEAINETLPPEAARKSYSAVIGRLYRLGLSRGRVVGSKRDRPARKGSKQPVGVGLSPAMMLDRARQRQEDIARAEGAAAGDDELGGVPFLDLRPGCCKWPLGPLMARPRFFCGEPAHAEGKPYCAQHRARSIEGRSPPAATAYGGGMRRDRSLVF